MTKSECSAPWTAILLVIAAIGVASAMGFVHCDQHTRPYFGTP